MTFPVIAVTAFAMAGDEKKALDHGCDAYVAKPIVLRDFLNLIAGFIGMSRIEAGLMRQFAARACWADYCVTVLGVA